MYVRTLVLYICTMKTSHVHEDHVGFEWFTHTLLYFILYYLMMF